MKRNKKREPYRCILFLKDASDRSLLVYQTRLFGQVIRPNRTVFMTPYVPPDNSLSWIGIVQAQRDSEHYQPLLINLVVKDDSMTACGFIDNQYYQMPVEIIYMARSYERTPFKASEMTHLWNLTVIIFGAGTGGSKIALEFARVGVGHLILCDPERLEFTNLSRHEGDLFDVGSPKVQVIAERIYRINPAICIETYFEDIFDRSEEEIRGFFNKASLVVDATDKRTAHFLINHFTQRCKIPAVFGGCYEEAQGGEVFFTLPDMNMPCWACLRGGVPEPERRGQIDYSTATGPEDYQGQPGLHAMVDFVTCPEIIICLAILLRSVPGSQLGTLIDPRKNFLLIGGALGAGFYRFKKPFDIFFQPLSGPRKTCPVCQPTKHINNQKNI